MRTANFTTMQAAKVWWSFTWRVILVSFIFGFAIMTAAWIFGLNVESYAFQQAISPLMFVSGIAIAVWAMRVALKKGYSGFRMTLLERDVAHSPMPVTNRCAAEILAHYALCGFCATLLVGFAVFFTLSALLMVGPSFGILIPHLPDATLIGLWAILVVSIGIWAMRTVLSDHYRAFDIAAEKQDREDSRIRHPGRFEPPAPLH